VDWSVRNDFSLTGRKKAISFLRRLSQLRQCLSTKDNLDAFSNVRIDAKDDLSSWADFLSDRLICLSFLQKNGFSSETISALKVENLLSLSNEALRRKNYSVSIKWLTVSNTHLTTLENQGSLAEKFNRCKVYDFFTFSG